MTTNKPTGTTKFTPTSDATHPRPEPVRLTVMEVAIMIGKRYHKTRDMMLAKKFGQPLYIDNKLSVELKEVEGWLARQSKTNVERPEER